MCGIIGIVSSRLGLQDFELRNIVRKTAERGADGWGMSDGRSVRKYPGKNVLDYDGPVLFERTGYQIANFRAEPTTEVVTSPGWEDQQPYCGSRWEVVHNGVIANDKELIKKFNLVPTTKIDSWVILGLLEHFMNENPNWLPWNVFQATINELEGSFSIIAHCNLDDSYRLHYATNYRPLYWWSDGYNTVVSSVKIDDRYHLVAPYSMGEITSSMVIHDSNLKTDINRMRCLVVLSGGLDSTVALASAIHNGYDCCAIHFDYGCRATSNEITAVKNIAAHYDIPLHIVPLNDLFTRVIGGSRLVDPEAQFAETIAGAEQAIEWVPARNTIMASIAIGFAEAHGYGRIMLGINNEESGGGYTDNVLDLYQNLNDTMQWIIGVGKTIKFEWPLGSMMKRHIVEEGLKLKAPMHLTWSCYNTGERHCGKCGPCFMRKTAFEINGAKDPVFECDDPWEKNGQAYDPAGQIS